MRSESSKLEGSNPGLRLDVADFEPLLREVLHEARRLLVGEQAFDLPRHAGWRLELTGPAALEQLVVGDAPPEEERQARGELQVAEPVRGADPRPGRFRLRTEQETRRRQQRLERTLDTRFEIARGSSFLVDGDERLHVFVRDRAPIGTPRQPAEILRARSSLSSLPRQLACLAEALRGGGAPVVANQNPGRLGVSSGVLPSNGPEIDSTSIPGALPSTSPGPFRPRDRRCAFGRGRGVGKRSGDQARPGLDGQPDFQGVVGVHPIVVQLLLP